MPHTVGGPQPTAARQGRARQRYDDDGARLVAGCIPVRYNNNTEEDADNPGAVRVLMITSRNGKMHVFPKGGWEVDESVETAAQRETVEEAGVRGELELPMLGKFVFRSGKAQAGSAKGRCVAHVFVMEVSEELEEWPEAGQRQRVWCTVHEAYRKVKYDWMREALRAWVKRKGWAWGALQRIDVSPTRKLDESSAAGGEATPTVTTTSADGTALPPPSTPAT